MRARFPPGPLSLTNSAHPTPAVKRERHFHIGEGGDFMSDNRALSVVLICRQAVRFNYLFLALTAQLRQAQPMHALPPLPLPSSDVPVLPPWLARQKPAGSAAEAAFAAGAALQALDGLVRTAPAWAGAWRQRLALKSAAAAARRLGRPEGQSELRDATHLRLRGEALGPGGEICEAFARLARRPPGLDERELQEIVALLGLRWHTEFAALPGALAGLDKTSEPPPFAAAALAARVVAPEAEVLAFWLAELGLARALRWPFAVPLLTAQMLGPAFRPNETSRLRPGSPGFERALCGALVASVGPALSLAREIAAHAARLAAAAPKIRVRGAGEVIALLLNEDAVVGTLRTPTLTRWATRRLFQRLVEFGAVREFSGRAAFKLYGI